MSIVESVSITTSTFPLRSQEEIGQGGGLSGSTRNFTSAIAVAVYTATLSNRLIATIPQHDNHHRPLLLSCWPPLHHASYQVRAFRQLELRIALNIMARVTISTVILA
ncbi:uncharacterized protein MYCFIDRAFT_200482 [Pseudocercospora fijiensis CIRAD86]|uniref:Uncharacterized protein n=1 Tax=Pseudocercospora fijiensis (strain CIRAD86) TaxID=383855 RepID=M3AL47_PSEFD|nr:uncharacterized protein MYCFIDRAFT_200482 [Pseudocercospora fijiensis CIRAD86]EME78172.1 hypothetical protein MYCFIDRAFT_200482 [Pseudocercospora fijiensis CIRAD86]